MSHITQVTFKLSNPEAAGTVLGNESFNNEFRGAEGYKFSISQNHGVGIFDDRGNRLKVVNFSENINHLIEIAVQGAYKNAFEYKIPIYFGNAHAKYEFLLLPTPNCIHCWADVTRPWGRINMENYAQATIVREAGGTHVINCEPNVKEQSKNSLRRYHIPEECLR